MENKTKAETFIGFAIKAHKVKMGINAVMTLKRANLMIVCLSTSENSVKKAKSIANTFNCKLLKTKEKLLEEIVHRENVKVIALTDYNLSQAIIANGENDFIEI